MAGKFVVLDGPDGSGKSTQFRRLADACREAGVTVTEVREPGGTPTGEAIRATLLDPAHTDMVLRCEMLLYMASRAQLVETRIAPRLKAGDLVLADRFVSSTLAYQGAAGGLPESEILAVARVAVGSVRPDLTIVFDVDERTAARRLNPILDRIEQRGSEFHRRVREGFLAQAAADPQHYLVVDASPEPDAVWDSLRSALAARFAT